MKASLIEVAQKAGKVTPSSVKDQTIFVFFMKASLIENSPEIKKQQQNQKGGRGYGNPPMVKDQIEKKGKPYKLAFTFLQDF